MEKTVINYQNFKYLDFDFVIGLTQNKIVYLGPDLEDMLKVFSQKKYFLQFEENINLEVVKKDLDYFFNNTENKIDWNNYHFQGTNLQISVWKYLTTIPFGATRTYLEVANGVNNPKAVRAVASAVGKNPINILIPCHRVVGKQNPFLYRGGSELKRKLLKLEKNIFKK